MSRYRSNGQLDDQIVESGDSHFIGFDTRLHPTLLKEGIAQRSENMRFDDFTATVRKGIDRITDNVIVAGNPLILPFQLGGSIPIASITETGGTAYVTLNNVTDPVIPNGETMTVQGATQSDYNISAVWSATDSSGLYYNYPVSNSPADATPEAITSGTLDIGVEYTITTFVSGDDFTNVGATTNVTGEVFTATGETPTTYSNGSTLTRSTITCSGLIGLVTDGVFATCLFSDVDTNKDYIAMATYSKAILVDPDNVGTTIEVPYGGSEVLEPSDDSEILQVNNGLILHRGKDKKALEWDGNVNATLPVTIVSATNSTTTATVTTFLNHGYQTGDIVTISGANEADYNGDQTITLLTATTFSYTMDNDPGGSATGTMTAELSPQFASIADTTLSASGYLSMPKADFSVYHPLARLIVPLRVLEIDAVDITRVSTTATVEVAQPHGLVIGDKITITGAVNPEYNGEKLITSIPVTDPVGTDFTFTVTGSPAQPDGGSAIKINVDVRDQFIISDIYDHKTYDPVENLFRVNRGSADYLIAFLIYQADNVIILYKRSIHILSATSESGLDDSLVSHLTSEVGCIARKTALIVGDNVIFLSEQGVYMLEITPEINLRGRDVPLSFDIQDEFRDLNYDYIENAVAVYFNNRYYIAVPSKFQSDGVTANTRNNIVFVYNFLNKKWESKDTFTGSANYIDNWVICQKAGQDRLFASSVEGALQLWEELEFDEIPVEEGGDFENTEIDGRLTTRRYIGQSSHDMKRFNRGTINFEVGTSDAFTVTATTENPETSVTALTEVATADEDKHKRFRINKRGTGLEIDINTTIGRPQIKSVSIGSTETQRANKTFE